MIQAFKNSEAGNEGINSPVGKRLDELSPEEQASIQGAGDVNPETTPACIYGGIAITIGVVSVAKCRG
ncbi:lichenicidin A2 family type 2 lantibiotic [Bacillus gibsonii]|nr:lichenicidin A2 family type 2 lantibiotic [Alkalicoccobacillus gibsonii]